MYQPGEKSISLWRVRAFLLALIPSVVCGVVWEFGSPPYLAATVVWLAVLLGALYLYIPLWNRSCRYQLEKDRVIAQTGVLYRQVRTIGRENIQYASVVQTLLQRVFGVATVVLHAPGGRTMLWDIELKEAMELSRKVMEKG